MSLWKSTSGNKDNIRKSWQILKDIINKKRKQSNVSSVRNNGNVISEKTQISNSFNSFFVNIGPTLARKIPKDSRSPAIYLTKTVNDSMLIIPALQEEITSIIKNLKMGSPGWDSISPIILKATYSLIVIPLTHVFNISLTKGVFPNEMKLAKVIPIFKSGDTTSFSNYRPVSVLPIF